MAAKDPVAALKNRLRGNIGRFPSLTPAPIAGLTKQCREHSGWTAQLHFDKPPRAAHGFMGAFEALTISNHRLAGGV